MQTHAPRGTVADLQPYNAATDILALDIYPVGVPAGANSLLPNKEISMVGDYAQFLSQIANGQKQYWLIEQIAWSGVTPPAKTLVFPTFRQERFMAYQAIIDGARGLMYFGGNIAATLNSQDAPLGWNWTFWDSVLKPVVQQLGDHSPLAQALVTTNSTLPITISGTTSPDLEFCVREVPPYLYILASKREGTNLNVTFGNLPAWATNGEVLYESPRTVTAQNGQLTDGFAPFDVHVYRFSQTNQPPVISLQPQSRTNYTAAAAKFNVTADGTGPLTFQWRKNGINLLNGGNISGATSSSLTISNLASSDAGNYTVVVTGFGNVTSAPPAVLTVISNQAPIITSQPQSQTNYAGTTATFSLKATGSGPFSFQWRKGGTNLSGAISSILTLTNVSTSDAGNYTVVVTGFGSVTSAPPASLAVLSQVNTLLLYEPFNYPNLGSAVSSNTPANWSYGGTGANDLNVTSGSLSLPGLAASLGDSVTNGGAGLGVRRLSGVGVNSGKLYFSALFRINDLGSSWNGAASQVGALTATDSASFRLAVMVTRSSTSNYFIGVQKGGTGAGPTFDFTEHSQGDTVFLVGKYDFTTATNTVSLWINPNAATFGSASEPTTNFISAITGTDGFAIDRFNMRQNTTASVPAAMQWDELRIGTSWASVTPLALPTVITLTNVKQLNGGAIQFAYTNNSGQSYHVYASTNLLNWTSIGTGTLLSPGFYQFNDTAATNYPRRFYQLRSP